MANCLCGSKISNVILKARITKFIAPNFDLLKRGNNNVLVFFTKFKLAVFPTRFFLFDDDDNDDDELFCGMADRRKAFSLISSQNHCQRSSPSQISNTLRAGFEPVQNLSSGLVEWSCAVVITTASRRHGTMAPRFFSCKFFYCKILQYFKVSMCEYVTSFGVGKIIRITI